MTATEIIETSLKLNISSQKAIYHFMEKEYGAEWSNRRSLIKLSDLLIITLNQAKVTRDY